MSSSTKSKLVAVRMPLELLAEIDKSDQGRSVFIIGAVRDHLRRAGAEAEKRRVKAPAVLSGPAVPGAVRLGSVCKCGGSGVMLVSGKAVCASCGRSVTH